jgi:hypothetical protein
MTAAAQARRAANSVWVDRVARLGFCARGVVYGVIGLIALQIARHGTNRGSAQSSANKEGALREIADHQLGRALLLVLAVGLGGYALWRISEALWGKRDEADAHKRTVKRLGSAGKAAVYVTLLVSTLRFVHKGTAAGGTSGDKQERSWAARTLDLPAGRLMVGSLGIALMAAGVYMIYRGLAQKFEKRLDTSDMGPLVGRMVDITGAVGISARGVVFGLAGFVAVKAAIDVDPAQAHGIDGTLRLIAHQTYGGVLLSATALGLVCYGIYSFAEARYRQL